tara:strand:- start:890 stop:1225 length:336 start_codon:yes stop_codon:yes gene_type:complete
MKMTESKLRSVIRQTIRESFSEDVKKLRADYDKSHGKLKEKAKTLREKKMIMQAVGMVNEKINSLVTELEKLPITDVLDNVKKSHSNKFTKCMETLKSITESSGEWLKENQ